MKKFFIPCLLLLCMIFSATSVKAYPSLTEKPNVAVMKIKNKALVSNDLNQIIAQTANNLGDVSSVSEFFIQSLINTGRFHVIEREGSLEVSNELNFSLSGMADTEDAPQIGKQKVAHYLVMGSLTGLTTKDSGSKGGANIPVGISGNIGSDKRNVTADVSIRFVNVETSEVVLAVGGRGESAVYNSKLSLNIKGQEVYETDDSESSNSPTPAEGKSITQSNYEFMIGSDKYNSIQVANAIKKAVSDAINNKRYGLIAKLDGTAKGERF